MSIPSISFPSSYDTDTTLYVVKDSAYLQLIKDYNPGDTEILVETNADKMALFPASGLITLTEQCSDPEVRALSFYYGSKTDNSFTDLTMLSGFTDNYKPANVTYVFMNVMAEHHNNIKDAVIEIEKYVGKQGEVALRPLDPDSNMEQRTNYLLGVAFKPKAWFSVDKTIGISPFTVTFSNQSVRMGDNLPDNNIQYFWDFGDNTGSNISYITEATVVPSQDVNVIVEDPDGGTIQKTYTKPGIFTVTLRSVNKYGEDSIALANLINVKYAAPDTAVMRIIPASGQSVVNGQFKTPVNLLVNIDIPEGINIATGRTYSGEEVDGSNSPIDPILTYTWGLSDNLAHGNSTSTRALYSVGGIYDVVLRVDTETEAYRITTFSQMLVGSQTIDSGTIDVVERNNLYLFTFVSSTSTLIQASEMGLLSETFKNKQNSYYTSYTANDNFLSNQFNSTQLIREFKRNTNFNIRAGNPSGVGGTAIIHYATGRNSTALPSSETIKAVEYSGFAETYSAFITLSRPWNWVALNYSNTTYFIFGNIPYSPANPKPAALSLTNQTLLQHNLINNTYISNTFTSTDYVGLASQLQSNAALFNTSGEEIYGYFSVYRTAWRDRVGYILKNDGVGSSFRIKSFYCTYEDGTSLIGGFKKLPDILGPTKYEGTLLNMKSNLFFFNNTGAVSAYDSTTNVWKTGGPGYNSVAFRSLQDSTVQNSDDENNTLLGTTDGADNAYLSFDYSPNSFIKFNDIDLTFTKMPERPTGNQWIFGNY